MTKEQQIIDKFGKNSTGNGPFAEDDLSFKEVTLSDGSSASEFYTYKGKVCILDNMGRDVYFTDYSETDQNTLFESIMK